MNIISFLGIFALLGFAWLLSYDKKIIPFKVIFWGIGLQLVFAMIILSKSNLSFFGMAILGALITAYQFSDFSSRKIKPMQIITPLLIFFGIYYCYTNGYTGHILFETFSEKVAYFLSLSDYGAKFLFGNLADSAYFFGDGTLTGHILDTNGEIVPGVKVSVDNNWTGFGFQFAFKVLPTIIFFGGFISVLYYLGIMQKLINSLSKFMRWTIGTSGAETLSCSANIFVGQTEAPLLIKPFINKMTMSELGTIMVGGFATIAGGVLAGYIALGLPAGHLIAASVMSAPAALVIGKIIFPEKEETQTGGTAELPQIETGSNVVEAASNGILDGLKLAVNVGAMLVGFIALIAVLDLLLNVIDGFIDGYIFSGIYKDYGDSILSSAAGEYSGYFPGSLQTFFGTVLRPLAFLMGVPWEESHKVGHLLGIKLSLNEFVAYGQLGEYLNGGLSERATIISTYALCGFANFSSIGIQLGGISALAPKRKADLAKIGLRAMYGGAIASWLTATIAGILI